MGWRSPFTVPKLTLQTRPNVDGLDLNILNITNIIDCLDKTKSSIEYFDEIGGNIMDVEQYVFKEELLENVTLFKLPQLSRSSIAVQKLVRTFFVSLTVIPRNEESH